ncbi:hydrogenase expression/formation protein HypE [Granulicella sp. 5B5]|uniref:hydrogenase expression/formation protein HypE n=1 Tax=Granulicella sp. 5B5 TaxID=1617967 RepID=UPI0015F3B562|nr:hydrogenase expression/formation protein HypE [Granulicella sp. 5B5]QMV19889.1 hydrogenase expression/formation protein HypE [Granulicella sp. 5B5]
MSPLNCPLPIVDKETVLLGHGGGGKLSADLFRDVFLPAFSNSILGRADDQAILDLGSARLAFTTDSFVVKPLFFRGGDIGSLAVHGTVNDLAVGGATPLFLSAAFILEEGFPLESLRKVVASMREAALQAGVQIVTGDTKVVEKGSCDGLFINTAGIGLVATTLPLSADQAKPGDLVLLSGPIGDHGIAILAEREGLSFETDIVSDSASLHSLVAEMLATGATIRCMRDPTRGGVASSCNEIAQSSRVGIQLEERAIPVRDEVRGACELLGLDPLYIANEGKLLAISAPEDAGQLLAAMQRHPLGREASIIGRVTSENPGLLTMRTALGAVRIVDMLANDPLPRIC